VLLMWSTLVVVLVLLMWSTLVVVLVLPLPNLWKESWGFAQSCAPATAFSARRSPECCRRFYSWIFCWLLLLVLLMMALAMLVAKAAFAPLHRAGGHHSGTQGGA
jgi:hypothetical protein